MTSKRKLRKELEAKLADPGYTPLQPLSSQLEQTTIDHLNATTRAGRYNFDEGEGGKKAGLVFTVEKGLDVLGYIFVGGVIAGAGAVGLPKIIPQLVPSPPADQCPNIEDTQEELPVGMVRDNDETCVYLTETVEHKRALEDLGSRLRTDYGNRLAVKDKRIKQLRDLCPNIDGEQLTVPEDYLKDEGGQCVRIETVFAQLDLCKGLPGVGIPQGYVRNSQGNCIEEPKPVDLCPNMNGEPDPEIQGYVPRGMVRDSGANCFKFPKAAEAKDHSPKKRIRWPYR